MRSLLLIIILWCLSLVGYNDALTIQLLDVAQKSSLEDGTYLTRIFFTNKNLTKGINYNSDQLNSEDFSFSLRDSSEEDDDDDESDDTFDSWSIVWYIASFSGLIAFFLIVSCSEWCCRNHIRRQQQAQQAQQTVDSSTSTTTRPSSPSRDVPPPSYELFAPPSYDSLWRRPPDGEKGEFDVYVVPVHAITGLYANSTNSGGGQESRLGSSESQSSGEDAPPSYSVVNLVVSAEQ